MKLIRIVNKNGQILYVNPDHIVMLKHTPAIPTAWPDYYTLVTTAGEIDLDETTYNELIGWKL